MPKKIFTFLLAVIMVILSVSLPVNSVKAASDTNNAKKVINALGIMKTDKGNTTSLKAKVTRAQYAQMLVNLSGNKGKVTGKSNVSLFKDVSKKYWASGYIQFVIIQEWMSGYLNGKFKPDKSVTLIEAVHGILSILGYSKSDFTGNVSAAEMALYKSKELNKNISKTKNSALTRQDCIHLFYNTLKATTKDGKIFAETLGYKIDSKGEIDYLSLVNSNLKGPIIADDSWKEKIPFFLGTATIYKDGTLGTLSDIQKYDVIYYSEDLNSVWAYDNKVTGTIQAISPNRLEPTSVTVGGKEYTLGTNDMSIAFSSMGKVDIGDTVTLLLGKDNTVVEVLKIDEYNVTITGIVVSTGEHLSTNKANDTTISNYVTYVDASGNEYQQDYSYEAPIYNVGDLIRVTYEDGVGNIKKIDQLGRVFGNHKFTSDASKVGAFELATNVKILDYYKGYYKTVNPKRLADVTLNDASVYYYELNSSGRISQMILNNVTGDVYQYGILTGINNQGFDATSYEYNINGTTQTAMGNFYIQEKGPKGFIFSKDNSTEIVDMIDLTGTKVTSIGSSTVSDAVQKYPMADNVAVFYYNGGKYAATTLDKVSDLKKYKLTAYYDRTISLGGRVRVIVAENNK
ncbi:MAG: SLH domain-containing protein [Lachnoclostridium sp.]|jgi:hypothetical protein